MKKRFLVLAGVLVLVVALAVPMAVSAAETTVVTATVATPTVTVTAPGAVGLGVIAYGPVWQYVVDSSVDGSVAVTDLAGKTFEATVASSSAKLVGATALANDLQIATGTDAIGQQIGDVGDAALLSSGAWVTPGVTVVPVTVAAQVIATGQTSTPLVLKLTAFQKINANENLTSGSYTLTLTYAGTVTN